MNIGDIIVEESYGNKLSYKVTGFDSQNRPISTLIGVNIVTSNTVEDIIEEIKEVKKAEVKKEQPKTKAPAKKPTTKKK